MADDMFAAMDEELGDMAPEEEAEESALDDELLAHAEAAGLSPEQAEAMKAFVERCVSLKDEGSYEAEEPAAETEDDEFI
jgi:hypothetical protein